MTRRLAFLAAVSVLCAVPSFAGGFGKLPVSARTMSLGGTLVALRDDPNVLFSNPAGIAGLTSLSLSTSYVKLFSGVTDDNLSTVTGAAVANLGFVGNLGIGVQSFRSDAWKEGTIVGTYGVDLFGIVTAGGSAKLLYWSAGVPAGRLAVPEDAMSKKTLSFDVGVQTVVTDIFPANDLIVGLAIRDLTEPSIARNGAKSAALDRTITAGVTYLSRALEYAVQAHYLRQGNLTRFGVGVEILASRGDVAGQTVSFTVRGGAALAALPDKQGDLSGGFAVGVEGLTLEYAFGQPTEIIGLSGTHLLTFRYSF